MRPILGLTILIFCLFATALAQEETPRQSVLSSSGNIKVSKLFGEDPVLPVEDSNTEIYRITFIPTFHNPIKIRVEKHKNNYVLIAKRLSGQGGYDAGELKVEKKRTLGRKEWDRLLDLLRKASFWELPYLEKKQEPNEKGEVTICLDGSEWVIEGSRNGQYHVVNRYCPEVKSFQAVGLYLAKLSRLGVDKRELY
ncbi:MAG: hypothetical protein IPL32_12925 [Chloracidobacterium sp.]|nr:hypothetical protein [Chloracidobacterium sp.]